MVERSHSSLTHLTLHESLPVFCAQKWESLIIFSLKHQLAGHWSLPPQDLKSNVECQLNDKDFEIDENW